MKKLLGTLAAGATGAYFFDPHNGKRRRHEARDRIAAFFRRRADEAGRKARYAEGFVEGAPHRAAEAARRAAPGAVTPSTDYDDVTLARKVETEIFRAEDAPKGDVNVNVEHGVVYLRGQVERPEQIEELVTGARKVEGVKEVENLLHVPGTPAPTKDEGHQQEARAA
jgi:hypothetical protein